MPPAGIELQDVEGEALGMGLGEQCSREWENGKGL